MREIKFRLYSDSLKVMYTPDNEIGGLWSIPEAHNGILKSRHEGDILMQYTGLKDKNGKDIYEGDVVKTSHLLIKKGIIKYWEAYHSYEIESLNGKTCITNKYDWNDLEIIGNIHENPELLKS